MIPEAAGEYFWKAGAAYCPGFFFLCLMSKNVFLVRQAVSQAHRDVFGAAWERPNLPEICRKMEIYKEEAV